MRYLEYASIEICTTLRAELHCLNVVFLWFVTVLKSHNQCNMGDIKAYR